MGNSLGTFFNDLNELHLPECFPTNQAVARSNRAGRAILIKASQDREAFLYPSISFRIVSILTVQTEHTSRVMKIFVET